MCLEGASILLTGGTGSFGKRFIKRVLAAHAPARLVVYSRDELKQFQLRQEYPVEQYPNLRFFIGDVRDRDRVYRAFDGVDVVVHAAALKQVPACEYNPFEAVLTNIIGAKNIIEAAIDKGVEKVLAVSTDKAVNPVILYGATKLVAEKLFVNGNAYAGDHRTRFACTRYGNVVGSRGSVVPLFKEQRKNGKITITDPDMTRFWITRTQGVRFVIRCIEVMHGGEIFVPKIPSMRVGDIADALAADCQREIIGIRAGEKMHEMLLGMEESRGALEFDDMYVIRPPADWIEHPGLAGGTPLQEPLTYSSDANSDWLSAKEFASLLGDHA